MNVFILSGVDLGDLWGPQLRMYITESKNAVISVFMIYVIYLLRDPDIASSVQFFG